LAFLTIASIKFIAKYPVTAAVRNPATDLVDSSPQLMLGLPQCGFGQAISVRQFAGMKAW